MKDLLFTRWYPYIIHLNLITSLLYGFIPILKDIFKYFPNDI